jgi:outer membrane biosynthesis protein TonB
MHFEAYDPAEEARALGLDRLPHPLNFADLASALREHYPAELAGSGIRGRVLLSLDLNASGVVTRAQAVEPPDLPAGMVIAAVLTDPDGRHRELTPARGAHPSLKRAAEEAAQVLRFSPAERGGKTVPFSDYRITVGLAPAESVP